MAALAAVVLVLSACNGDDDASPTVPTPVTSDTLFVTTTTESTEVSPTTSQDTATTEESTTSSVSPSTSSAPQTSTETVPLTLPSTTTVPLDGLTTEEREVVGAVLEAFRLFNELRLDPTDAAKFEAALARLAEPSLTSSEEFINEYRELGQKEVPFPQVPATVTPYLDTLSIDDDTASIDVCWLNSNVLVEVGGGPDGGDRVVNDIISAHYRRYDLIRSGAAWLVSSIAGGEVTEGALTCD